MTLSGPCGVRLAQALKVPRLPIHRVPERQAARHQLQGPLKVVRALRLQHGIHPVPHDGQAQRRQLRAQLVLAPGDGRESQQGQALAWGRAGQAGSSSPRRSMKVSALGSPATTCIW